MSGIKDLRIWNSDSIWLNWPDSDEAKVTSILAFLFPGWNSAMAGLLVPAKGRWFSASSQVMIYNVALHSSSLSGQLKLSYLSAPQDFSWGRRRRRTVRGGGEGGGRAAAGWCVFNLLVHKKACLGLLKVQDNHQNGVKWGMVEIFYWDLWPIVISKEKYIKLCRKITLKMSHFTGL